MNEDLIKALIGLGGLFIGAVATVIAAWFSTRMKVREVELLYSQRLNDAYLANARHYTKGIYVPLNIAISKLANAYYQLNSHISGDDRTVDNLKLSQFIDASNEYTNYIDEITLQGADAFLTTALDEYLRSFTSFVRASVDADVPSIRVISSVRIGLAGMNIASWDVESLLEMRGRLERFLLRILGVASRLPRLGVFDPVVTKLEKQLLRAPVASKEYEEQFILDLNVIKGMIREVTLGAHTSV